jgi:hypothetical protein
VDKVQLMKNLVYKKQHESTSMPTIVSTLSRNNDDMNNPNVVLDQRAVVSIAIQVV